MFEKVKWRSQAGSGAHDMELREGSGLERDFGETDIQMRMGGMEMPRRV